MSSLCGKICILSKCPWQQVCHRSTGTTTHAVAACRWSQGSSLRRACGASSSSQKGPTVGKQRSCKLNQCNDTKVSTWSLQFYATTRAGINNLLKICSVMQNHNSRQDLIYRWLIIWHTPISPEIKICTSHLSTVFWPRLLLQIKYCIWYNAHCKYCVSSQWIIVSSHSAWIHVLIDVFN